MKDLYDFRKSYKMCVDCGKEKAIRGETLCPNCKDRRLEWRLKRELELTDAERADFKARQAAYQKARRDRLISEGLCVSCGKRKAERTLKCEKCRLKYNRLKYWRKAVMI